jgi:putative transposase
MWQDSAAQFPPCIPATPDELLVLLSKRADRTLSPRGIELGCMFYTSDELMALRSELASHNLDADRVAVRYNPWDLGDVWVLNPIDNAYLKAPAVDPAMKGMTEYQWRVLKRAIRERFDQPDHLLNLAAGRNAIRDVIEAAMQKPSWQRRVRAARFLQPAPSLTGEPEESDNRSGKGSSPGESAAPGAEALVPGAPESIGNSDAHHGDPSEVNVDDWEVAGPDL